MPWVGHFLDLLGLNGAHRYVFTIHSKLKHGITAGASFIVAYFMTDELALAFGDWLQDRVLANRATVTVSRTIRIADNEELPPGFMPEDEQTVKILLGSSQDRDVRLSLRIPKVRTSLDATQLARELVSKETITYRGKVLDNVITVNGVMHNIAMGPPTEEPGFQGQAPPPVNP